MKSSPFVSVRETPVQRIRYFAFGILVCNAVFLAAYGPLFKPRLLQWAASNPDIVDAAYYKLVFSYLELPIVLTLLVSALVLALATRMVRTVRRLAKSEHWMVWLLVIVGAIQLGIALNIESVPHSDSIFYLERAERLATTFTYTTSVGEPTAFWPVGYPAMLAAVRLIAGNRPLGYRLFHILIYLGLVLLLYRSFRRAGGRSPHLVAFILLYALHPNGLLSVNAILTEFPFMLLMWLGIYFLLGEKTHPWAVLAGGVCFGLAALVKPLVLGLAFVLALYLIVTRRKKTEMLRMAVFAGAFTLVIIPWMIRNAVLFHDFVPVSTNGGLNFYIGNNPKATGKFEPTFFQMKPEMNEAERSRMAFRAGLDFIFNHPGDALRLVPKKIFFAFWRGDASLTWSLKKTESPIPLLLPAVLFYYTNLVHHIMLFGLIIMVWYRKWIFTHDNQNGLFAVVFAYFLLVVIVFFGSERFLAPVMPIPLWFLASWLMGEYSEMDSFVAGKPGHVRRGVYLETRHPKE